MATKAKITLLADNKYARLSLEDAPLMREVSKLLSYKEPGAEFTVQAQRFGWNGITLLMNKKGQFPVGLVTMVENLLKSKEVELETVDERKGLILAEPLDISARLSKMGKKPRYYQIKMAQAAVSCRLGIIKACTGSGKTLAAAIITAALNKPTNIFVIGLDLLQQFHDLFSEVFDEEIGYVGNGTCEIRRINIISLWTAAKAIDPKGKIKIDDDDEGGKEEYDESQAGQITTALKSGRVVMFDECHSASTESFKKLYSIIEPEHLYGLSGTPHRMESNDLLIKALLGDIIVDVPASELIDKGFLVKPVIKFFEVPKEFIDTRNYASIYKEYVVENPVRNGIVVSATKKLVDGGYQTLVLFRQISHGKKLLEMLRDKGVEAEMLSGTDKIEKRQEIKDRLLAGELRCVVASAIYDIGVDISSLNALVLASPNKSLVRALQRIGRVIRPHPGKTEVRVVDFIDQALYLKTHSKRRYEIYRQEKGFEVLLPKTIKL